MEPSELLDHFPLDARELDLLLRSQEDLDPLLRELLILAKKNVFVPAKFGQDDQARHLEACVSLLGRRGDRFLLDLVYKLAGQSPVTEIVKQLCEYTWPEKLGSAIDSLFSNADTSTEPDWRTWASNYTPGLPGLVQAAFTKALFDDEPSFLPILDQPSDILTNDMRIQCALMGMGGSDFRAIYRSDHDGFSFSVLESKLTAFVGSTLVLIETRQHEVIGYYTDLPWKQSLQWNENTGDQPLARLMSLSPNWNVYLPTPHSKYHQFLFQPPTSYRTYALTGLAVDGVAAEAPRLHLPVDFDKEGTAGSVGTSFANGNLLKSDSPFFTADRIEVWTFGSSYDDGKRLGEAQASVQEAARVRLAKVDREDFLEDFRQGAYLTKTFDAEVL